MKQIKDIDYIFLSTRIKAMESRLLNRERIDRMLDAPTHEDAAKVLTECGYGELTEVTGDALELILDQRRQQIIDDLRTSSPDPSLVDIFRIRTDYHNAKVLVKSEALGIDQNRLLLRGGRYEAEKLADEYRREDLRSCSDVFRSAVSRARETIGSTGDPQMSDFVLDRACFEELTALAAQSGSRFLEGYAALCIDVANLRSAVRVSRLDKGQEFLNMVVVPGGTVGPRTIVTARGDELGNVFRTGPLAEAAAEGAARSAPGSGPLTEFERLCDDAVMKYLEGGHMIAFGVEPVVGFLYGCETEITVIRTIMSGRLAGLDSDTIRQRLRRTYA